jgi:HK97 family phage prohead protease
MYEFDNVQYKEVIRRGAFDRAQMQDVVLNFNHQGKPVARTKNKTLDLRLDDVGLFVSADLSGTEEGRRLYEEIKGGYIDKMSFAFKALRDKYIRETRTRELEKFKQIFDVAACDHAAYDDTNIQARSYFQAEAERELAEARELRKRKLKILLTMEV